MSEWRLIFLRNYTPLNQRVDPSTLASQVNKLKERFALERVVLIGDRGMITKARLARTVMPAGLD